MSDLLSAFDPNRIHVPVIAGMKDGPLRSRFEKEVYRLGGDVYTAEMPLHDSRAAGRRVARIAKKCGATHLHGHLLRADMAGREAAISTGLPYAVTEHGLHGWSEKGQFFRPFVRHWYLTRRPKDFQVVAISRRVKRELRETGVRRGLIKCIPNGIPLDQYSLTTNEQREGVRFDLTIPPDAFPVLLMLGGLVDRKRPEMALRVIAGLRKVYPRAYLIVAGDGPLRDSLNGLAGTLNLASAVTFLGYIQDPTKAIQAADILIHPAASEPFGLALAESLTCGLPVVTRAGAVSSELLPAAPCSAQVDGDDVATWIGATSFQASRIDEDRKAVAEKCRAYGLGNFGLEKMAAGYMGLYISE